MNLIIKENIIYKKMFTIINKQEYINSSIFEFLNVVSLKIKKIKINNRILYILGNLNLDYVNNYVNNNDLSFEEYNLNKIKIPCNIDIKELFILGEEIFKFYTEELSKLKDSFIVFLSLETGKYKSLFVTFYKYRKEESRILGKINEYKEEAVKIGYINCELN